MIVVISDCYNLLCCAIHKLMIVVICCAVQSEIKVPLKQYDGDSKINLFAADPLVGVHFICDRVTWSNYNQCLLVTSLFSSGLV